MFREFQAAEKSLLDGFQAQFNPLLGKAPPTPGEIIHLIDLRRNLATVALINVMAELAAIEVKANGGKLPDDCAKGEAGTEIVGDGKIVRSGG
jgi:hypothetical protein